MYLCVCVSVCVGYEMVSLLWEGLAMVGFGVRFWHSILASYFGLFLPTCASKQTNKQDQSFSII